MKNAIKLFRSDRSVVLYGISLALLLFILKWFELRLMIMSNAMDVYIGLVALLFTGLGIWLSLKLMKPRTIIVEKEIVVRTKDEFIQNRAEIEERGLSQRELEVLEGMAAGLSNQEIADKLFLSVNTIKTHCSGILSKLEARRRTQAIEKAKNLRIIR